MKRSRMAVVEHFIVEGLKWGEEDGDGDMIVDRVEVEDEQLWIYFYSLAITEVKKSKFFLTRSYICILTPSNYFLNS